jgi:transglutaminase-like putative cysteine protease
VREFERDGKTYLYGTKEQRITVARFGTRVELWEKESTLETPDGQVLVVRRSQGVGNQQVLAIVGQVDGKQLKIKGEGNAAGATDTVPFPEGVIGIAKEASLMKDKKPTVGGEPITYQYYAGQVNWVAKFTITAKAEETQTLYVGDTPRKLVKVEVAMDPIKDKQGGVVALPAATVWLDAVSYEPLKAEFENAPLGGTMVLLRTTKDAATRPPGKVPDLFTVQSIALDKAVENIHNKKKVTYAVQLKGDADPATAFTQDSRQSYTLVDGPAKAFTIAAGAIKTPANALEEKYDDEKGQAYLKECLGTSFYIDWDNPKTKAHATAAVSRLPATATAWDKAKAVEAWVRANMNPATFENSMDTCSKVSQTMNGDCSEFSVLATGMCRSLGIPARTALGLVYAPDRAGKPFLAYHMWFEVYVDNRWVALDGTLAMGGIGPGHLTITRATWHNERSMAPLLPVMRLLMAKPQMQVSGVE